MENIKENTKNTTPKLERRFFIVIRKTSNQTFVGVGELSDTQIDNFINQKDSPKEFFASITKSMIEANEFIINNYYINKINCLILSPTKNEINNKGLSPLPTLVNFYQSETIRKGIETNQEYSSKGIAIIGDCVILKRDENNFPFFTEKEAIDFCKNLGSENNYISFFPKHNPVFQMTLHNEPLIEGKDFFNAVYVSKEELNKIMN